MTHNLAIREAICERLAKGESLRSICLDDDMPDKSTVLKWLREDADFSAQYARARELQAEHYLDEIIQIADDSTDDIIFLTEQNEEVGEGAVARLKHSAIQRARLQVDTRKWAMSKLAPKKYGEKQEVEHSGTVRNENIDLTLSDKERAAIRKEMDAEY